MCIFEISISRAFRIYGPFLWYSKIRKIRFQGGVTHFLADSKNLKFEFWVLILPLEGKEVMVLAKHTGHHCHFLRVWFISIYGSPNFSFVALTFGILFELMKSGYFESLIE